MSVFFNLNLHCKIEPGHFLFLEFLREGDSIHLLIFTLKGTLGVQELIKKILGNVYK